MIETYGLEQAQRWTQIVSGFKEHDIYYLPQYMIPFQVHGDGTPLLLYFRNDTTRAINVVMKREINSERAAGYSDFVTPYGYGGFIIEGPDTASLKKEYEDYCVKNRIVSEFARFHPLLKNSGPCGEIYELSELGNTVAITLNSEEQIWQDFDSSRRNHIRYAQKNGVRIEKGYSQELFEVFRGIYEETMVRDNAAEYYFFKDAFFTAMLDNLRENALIFTALYNETAIAASIFIFGNNNMHYHLSGAKIEYMKLNAVSLILYEAALFGLRQGFVSLHLGGGVGSRNGPLFDFKKSFNKRSTEQFVVGKKCFIPDTYDLLVDERTKTPGFDPDAGFFPLYRA